MKYLAAALAGIVLALALALWVSGRRLDAARDKLADLRFELTGAEATVKLQADSLARWQAAGQAQAERIAQARADAAAAQVAAEALRRRLAALQQEDSRRDDCQTLLAVDLRARCPGHAAALRLSSGLQGQAGDGPGAGGDAAAGRAGGGL